MLNVSLKIDIYHCGTERKHYSGRTEERERRKEQERERQVKEGETGGSTRTLNIGSEKSSFK